MRYNILVTGKERGSTAALDPIAKELANRGHNVIKLATGSNAEAEGFTGKYEHEPEFDFTQAQSLENVDFVVAGASGVGSPDYRAVRQAFVLHKPSMVVVGDTNQGYDHRLGTILPTRIAVMHSGCVDRLSTELSGNQATKDVAELARDRAVVVGYTALDSLAKSVKEEKYFDKDAAKDKLRSAGISLPDGLFTVYFSQHLPTSGRPEFDAYERMVTKRLFTIASDTKQHLVVRPHPREKDRFLATEAAFHGFTFIPADHSIITTPNLMRTADVVLATRSAALNESTVLGIDSAAMAPYIDDLTPWAAMEIGAVPVARTLNEMDNVFEMVTFGGNLCRTQLAGLRKRFNDLVDGKASERVADTIEEILGSH